MNKKGVEIATGTVVMIIVGLIVLVIITLVFRQQATKGAEGYEQFGTETKLEQDKCASIILGRACAKTCATGTTQQFSPTGTWKDCTGDTTVCCSTR